MPHASVDDASNLHYAAAMLRTASCSQKCPPAFPRVPLCAACMRTHAGRTRTPGQSVRWMRLCLCCVDTSLLPFLRYEKAQRTPSRACQTVLLAPRCLAQIAQLTSWSEDDLSVAYTRDAATATSAHPSDLSLLARTTQCHWGMRWRIRSDLSWSRAIPDSDAR